MVGDVKDLLKCCLALITLTVVMNQLLLSSEQDKFYEAKEGERSKGGMET